MLSCFKLCTLCPMHSPSPRILTGDSNPLCIAARSRPTSTRCEPSRHHGTGDAGLNNDGETDMPCSAFMFAVDPSSCQVAGKLATGTEPISVAHSQQSSLSVVLCLLFSGRVAGALATTGPEPISVTEPQQSSPSAFSVRRSRVSSYTRMHSRTPFVPCTTLCPTSDTGPRVSLLQSATSRAPRSPSSPPSFPRGATRAPSS